MTREELYQRFGHKLVDAVCQVMLAEINLLRTNASLPERTSQQLVDALGTKLDSIPDYPWMGA